MIEKEYKYKNYDVFCRYSSNFPPNIDYFYIIIEKKEKRLLFLEYVNGGVDIYDSNEDFIGFFLLENENVLLSDLHLLIKQAMNKYLTAIKEARQEQRKMKRKIRKMIRNWR